MSKFKRYERYKDSGVEWIGEIPEHWGVIKLKYVTKLAYGDSLPTENREEEGEVDVFGSNGKVGTHNVANTLSPVIIVGRKGSYGKVTYSDKECFAIDTTYYIDNRCTKSNIKWLYHSLMILELDKNSQDTGVPGLSREYAYNKYVPVPTVNEQAAIANFLDQKTAEIDGLIADKEKLIELLQEKRQAIITEAVTKGLNPNVRMKDSGVEWIGEIPEHWNLKKIKYTTYVKGRIGWQGLCSDEFIDEGPYLVTGTDFLNGIVNWESCYHISEERYNEAPPIQLKEGDLLITKDGTIGKVVIVKNKPNKAILNSGIFVTRSLKKEYLTEFMYYLLNSQIFERYIRYVETGSTIKHLYQETFVNFMYPLPSIEEQVEIIEYLNYKVKEIDDCITFINQQIQKLKEYRQSLMSEAVTGKIDVRDYADNKL